MTHDRLDRRRLRQRPLAERRHKLEMAQIAVDPDAPVRLDDAMAARVAKAAARISAARRNGRPVILTFGAHLIKNGLGPVVIRLLEAGWLTHVATNGAGSIHDWEFAFLGRSTEDVRANTAAGAFGLWEETGRFINLAVAVGGVEGLGYGASVGKMIAEDGLQLPSRAEVGARIAQLPSGESLGALADLYYLLSEFDLPTGRLALPHAAKACSVQAAAWRLGIPFTVHPGIGYDIIYTHPLNCGGAIGRGAVRDFLAYAASVRQLSGGAHLSVGSAIMAPMIFEKSLSMANNLALQEEGAPLSDYYLLVNDLQPGEWDWSRGEPPMDHPAYYLRFCKTFHRMGGELEYLCLDNRAFLPGLYQALRA
ncbi:MAG: GSU2086 family protein [Armatimonadota bacterium]